MKTYTYLQWTGSFQKHYFSVDKRGNFTFCKKRQVQMENFQKLLEKGTFIPNVNEISAAKIVIEIEN